ncbi:MAG: SoxR reducing system RseC family protein, partial [Bacteroidales bacterium]|nr:SoxR reducing system RseC family protein [Bacteroidales bacterium]
MEDCSTQYGIVTKVQTDRVFVLVEQKSACASCHARGACSSFDKKNKTIEVATKQASDYKKGDKVEVSISTRLGMKAVVIAFLVPFVLLVISLILCLKTFDFSEP